MMNTSIKICLTSMLLLTSTSGFAYNTNTHEKISEAAVTASQLNSMLRDFGIDEAQKFNNSKGEANNYLRLIQNGAVFEDDQPRPLNHFFNPINGAPLSLGGIPLGVNSTSPDWALEDRGDKTFQAYSYKDARSYFYNALTKSTKSEREKNFGLMFESVGHVIHHIQDMAQPQHVRNDQHLEMDSWKDELALCRFSAEVCIAYFLTKTPSLYEALSSKMTLPFGGYAPVYPNPDSTAFQKPRDFWEGNKSRGLAEFTNLNFVSAGTNFDKPGLFQYPQFDVAKRTKMNIQDLCANRVPACQNPNLSGEITFFGNDVADRNTGQTMRNPYASSMSFFDADLTKNGMNPVFTLNRFNFELAHTFLIPRAVGYSAGLINYFFRGQIDFKLDPGNPGKYLIKNLSNEQMDGTFALYYDDKDDQRHLTPNKWDAKTVAAMSNASVTLQPNALGDPPPKEIGKYTLVFNGAMGQEAAGAATPPTGAVAAKAVKDPVLMSFTRVLFSPAYPNLYNPTTQYFLDSNIKTSQEMVDIIAAAAKSKKNITLLIDGQPLHQCYFFDPLGIDSTGLDIACFSVSYPYTEVVIDVTGLGNASHVPYFDLDSLPDIARTISLKIEDTVLFQFTFKPKSIQDFSPVDFTDAFHIDAKNATFGQRM